MNEFMAFMLVVIDGHTKKHTADFKTAACFLSKVFAPQDFTFYIKDGSGNRCPV